MDRPICKCGNLCKSNGRSNVDNRVLYNTYCISCSKTRHGTKPRAHRLLKSDTCVKCGFKAVHFSQMDIDHIDGNKKNNHISNYQTLCSNCHRLKTYQNRDWIKK